MRKGKFNKFLSRMESMYAIANPVPVTGDPAHVSDFIHAVFENAKDYGIDDTGLTPEWFSYFSNKNRSKAVGMIHTFLQESGHIVSTKTINEGIDKFNEGFENA